MEEDLRSEEPLVSDIDQELLARDGVGALVLLDPLSGVRVVLRELLHDVRADVAVPLLWAINSVIYTYKL